MAQLIKNRKGVSLMISYVLLIILAIGLSYGVYTYLKTKIPLQKQECPTDISIAIEEAVCDVSSRSLNLTLSNRGLFNVSGVFIRFGPSTQEIGKTISTPNGEPLPIGPGDLPRKISLSDQRGYKALFQVFNETGMLNPGASPKEFTVKVQPFIRQKNVAIPCEIIATQKVMCG